MPPVAQTLGGDEHGGREEAKDRNEHPNFFSGRTLHIFLRLY